MFVVHCVVTGQRLRTAYNHLGTSQRLRVVVLTSPPWGVTKEPHDVLLTQEQMTVLVVHMHGCVNV